MQGRMGTLLLERELRDEQRELSSNGAEMRDIILIETTEGLDLTASNEVGAFRQALRGCGSQATPAAHSRRDVQSFKLRHDAPEFISLDDLARMSDQQMAPSPEDLLIEKQEYGNVEFI